MNELEKILNLRREKFLLRLLKLTILVSFFYAMYWFYFDNNFSAYTLLFNMFVAVPIIYLGKKKISLEHRAMLLLLGNYITIFFCNIVLWKTTPIILLWQVLIPIGALIFFNKKKAVFWLTMVVISFLITPFVFQYFPTATLTLGQKHFIEITQLSGILIVIVFLVTIYGDIFETILKIINEQKDKLKLTSEKLQKNQKFKDRFFASISHELRTPLNAIHGISELLIPNTEEDKLLIGSLKNSTQHLLALINDLLDISKLKEGKLILAKVDFNLREVLNNSFDIVKIASKEKQIAYFIEIEDKLPEYINGDPHRLTQILINLLNNAMKFTQKGHIALRCSCNTSSKDLINNNCRLCIEIEDTGIGIDEKIQNRLFEGFIQGDENTSVKYGGSGLGLAITKNLVEIQGGSLSFISKTGKGTVFYIDLPFVISQNKVIMEKENVENIPSKKIKSILIVDDNKLNLMVAEKQIKKIIGTDIKIDLAYNGKIALDLVSKTIYDIILMDMKMPEMDGIEASREIRNSSNPDINKIPIIMMTANVSLDDINACFEAGVNDYISKPYEIKHLLQKMNNLV